jgi:hypothetical protein
VRVGSITTLILDPLFGDCAHPGASPYMVNTVDVERKRKETNRGVKFVQGKAFSKGTFWI